MYVVQISLHVSGHVTVCIWNGILIPWVDFMPFFCKMWITPNWTTMVNEDYLVYNVV